jgi:GTPase SAR1 family protein
LEAEEIGMKIVMLGHSGVGKTTYIASLYGVMQQQIEGFRLEAVNPEDHKQLLQMSSAIALGKYPSPTAQRSEYQFSLHYQNTNLLNFALGDYRGGAIRETQNSEEAQLLIQDLRQASGIIMFSDCEAISRGDIRSNEIGRMTTLVMNALQDLSHPLSLAIVLTKTDLIEQFDEKILNPFMGIIGSIEGSKLVSGCLIPVACGTQQINLPMPLLFTLPTVLSLYAPEVQKIAQELRVNAQDFDQNSGFLDTFQKAWNGEPTNKDLANAEREKAIAKDREFEEINKAIEALSKYLQQLALIQAGKSINDYLQKLSQLKSGTNFIPQQANSSSTTSSDLFDAFNN